jgi:membrane protein YqaA with SNARE-associated domain
MVMVYLYLFFSAFISATLFPLGSEALLLYDIKEGFNIYFLFISASIGNSLGSILNYYFGLKGEEYLLSKKLVSKKYISKSKQYFDKYGSYSLLLSWMPIVGDPITFVAGVLKYNFKKFVLLVFISKSLRYIFLIISYLLVE